MWRADVPAGVCEQAPCTLAPRASEGADANTRHAGIAYTPYACTQAWAWADKIAPARSPKTARRSMQFHVHRGVPSVDIASWFPPRDSMRSNTTWYRWHSPGGGGPQTGWETTMLLFVHIIVVSALVVGGGFGAVSMLWVDSNEVPASNPETPRTPAPSPR